MLDTAVTSDLQSFQNDLPVCCNQTPAVSLFLPELLWRPSHYTVTSQPDELSADWQLSVQLQSPANMGAFNLKEQEQHDTTPSN